MFELRRCHLINSSGFLTIQKLLKIQYFMEK